MQDSNPTATSSPQPADLNYAMMNNNLKSIQFSQFGSAKNSPPASVELEPAKVSADNLPADGQRKKREVFKCPHQDKKHYAKNMCINCYHRRGRTKKAWDCPHSDKLHYSKGLCQNCYLAKYYQAKKGSKRKPKAAAKEGATDELLDDAAAIIREETKLDIPHIEEMEPNRKRLRTTDSEEDVQSTCGSMKHEEELEDEDEAEQKKIKIEISSDLMKEDKPVESLQNPREETTLDLLKKDYKSVKSAGGSDSTHDGQSQMLDGSQSE